MHLFGRKAKYGAAAHPHVFYLHLFFNYWVAGYYLHDTGFLAAHEKLHTPWPHKGVGFVKRLL